MTLSIPRHQLIELIKEDIKLNYLVFALQDIGLECNPELLNLSPVIFSICGVDMEKDLKRMEDYYHAMNRCRGKSFETICGELSELSDEVIRKLLEE